MHKKLKSTLSLLCFLAAISFSTIAYSAYNTQLHINGEVTVRADADIRITALGVINTTNNAYETYNNKYGKDTTSIFATLPANSSIIYEAEITNKTNKYYLVSSINNITHSNNNVSITSSLNINDRIDENQTKTFTITLTNNTNSEQIETLVTEYSFIENAFAITFNGNEATSTDHTKSVVARYAYLLPSITVPTKTGYTFAGYYDSVDVKELSHSSYLSGRTYRIDTLSDSSWSKTKEGDVGKHLSGIIKVVGAKPNIEFNDRTLSSNMYTVNEINGTYIYTFDFNITDTMLTDTQYKYSTSYRFIDLEGISSSNTVTIDYFAKGGKKYYDASGNGLHKYDTTGDMTLYALWENN